jgi:hypothetical protein
VVVAVPPPLVVQGDDEEVLPLEGVQHRPAARSTGQGVAEAAGQLVEHRGVEQELPHLVRLPVQHLLQQVVQNEAVVAGERIDEGGRPVRIARLGAPARRQRGQLQADRPSLGAGLQSGDVHGIEIQPHDVVEERAGLVGREAQVRGTELQEFATGT